MAFGQPIARAQIKILDALGEEQVLAWRSEGDSWRTLCQRAADWARANEMEANLAGQQTMSVQTLNKWLKKAEGRRERWDACQELCAESQVGQAED